MKPVKLFALALLFLLARAGAAAPSEADIDALFRDYAKPGAPGASVVIVEDGKVAFAKGYGLSDVENDVAAASGTHYRLASVSKQFTAMAVLQLAAAGKLSLDDPLTAFFPEFPAYGGRITVRHLLHHQGGLRDYEDLIPSSQSGQLSDRDVLAILQRQKSGLFPPGSRYQYSNGGYVLLGLVVETASGMTFTEYLTRHVFGPAGMATSVMHVEGVTTVVDRAYGHSRSGGGWRRTDQSQTSATQGDGGVYTSVDELVLWDRALESTLLLPAEYLKLLATPGTLNDGSATGYGMGWMLDTYRGLRRMHHTGSTIGFRTAIQRIPEKRFMTAVLVNRNESSPWKIGERITDLVLFGGK